MTEDKWLASDNPDDLLNFVQDRLSDRKRRLFACACVRMIWDLLIDGRSRRAVECAERLANGQVPFGQTHSVVRAARAAEQMFGDSASRTTQPVLQSYHAAHAAALTLVPNADLLHLSPTFCELATIQKLANLEPAAQVRRQVRGAQCRVFRCLLGNPFRPIHLEPRCFVWNGGVVVKIARRIDETQHFGHLPVLADALEEAGCTSESVLTHCREERTHALGCHVLDYLLSRD